MKIELYPQHIVDGVAGKHHTVQPNAYMVHSIPTYLIYFIVKCVQEQNQQNSPFMVIRAASFPFNTSLSVARYIPFTAHRFDFIEFRLGQMCVNKLSAMASHT